MFTSRSTKRVDRSCIRAFRYSAFSYGLVIAFYGIYHYLKVALLCTGNDLLLHQDIHCTGTKE